MCACVHMCVCTKNLIIRILDLLFLGIISQEWGYGEVKQVDWGALQIDRNIDTILWSSHVTSSSFPNQCALKSAWIYRQITKLDLKLGLLARSPLLIFLFHMDRGSDIWISLEGWPESRGRKEGKDFSGRANSKCKGHVGVKTHGLWRQGKVFLLLSPRVLAGSLRWVLWAGEARCAGGRNHLQEFWYHQAATGETSELKLILSHECLWGGDRQLI